MVRGVQAGLMVRPGRVGETMDRVIIYRARFMI
jgi:hypothetical protein